MNRTHKLWALLLLLLIGGIATGASLIEGDLSVTGTLTAGSFSIPAGSVVDASISSGAAITRTKMATETLAIEIPLAAWRVHDSLQPLPATAASDDLGWYPGTYLTNSPLVRTQDVKALGAQTLRARCTIALPENYVSAGSVTIRARAGAVTTAADVSMTLDFEAAEIGDATPGSDLVTTAATSINNTTFANRDFVCTSAALVAGDTLDVRMTIAVNDGASATAVIAAISKTWLVLQVKS